MSSSSPENTSDLWLDIDQLHLDYLLQHEDTPQKHECRKRLERRVKEYLSIVTQERKFVNITTGDIIINSAKWIPEFSLVKAAQAFRYIEQYAANLINQPWRQEYRAIRLYNGYYMHNVKSSLSGAEKLFFDMGYTRSITDPEIIELKLPPNGDISGKIDSVTKVARDCLLACVECTILQEIYSGLAAHFPVTVEELLDFRRDYAGTPEEAIRELQYRKNQIMFHPYPAYNHRMSQMYAPYSVGLPGFAAYAAAGGGLAPLGGGLHPAGYPLAAAAAVYPSTAVAAGSLVSPGSGGGILNGHGLTLPQQVPVSSMNGFYPPPPPAVSPQQRSYSQVAALSSVATGRLLDLEHSPAGSSTSTLRQAHIPTTILELTAGEEKSKSNDRFGGGARPRDSWADSGTTATSTITPGADKQQQQRPPAPEPRRAERCSGNKHGGGGGGGSRTAATTSGEEMIENWEFVFHDLQQRGYTKDQAERPDVLTAARPSRGNTETPSSSRMYNLTSGEQSEEEEVMRNLGFLQLREESEPIGGGEEREPTATARHHHHHNHHRASRELTSESEQENSKYSSAQSKNSSNTERDYRQALLEKPQRANRTRSGHETENWSCEHCTFLNLASSTMCEVCFRTPNSGLEQPRGVSPLLLQPAAAVEPADRTTAGSSAAGRNSSISRSYHQEKDPVGSYECSRCTLVNVPGARTCEACGSSLGLPPIIPTRKRV